MTDRPPATSQFPIRIGEAFATGWRGYRSNFASITMAGAAVWAVMVGIGFVGSQIESPWSSFFVQLGGVVLASGIALPWYRGALDAVDGAEVNWANMLRNPDRLSTLLGASVFFWASFLFGLRYFSGLPALIVLAFYAFYGFVVADSDRGVLKSLGHSILVGQGRRIGVFAIGAMLVLVNFLAFLPIGQGVTPVTQGASLVLLVVTSSYTIVCGAAVYRALDSSMEDAK